MRAPGPIGPVGSRDKGPFRGLRGWRRDSLAMAGNLSKRREPWIKTLALQNRELCNRPVTCPSKKQLLIILKDAACFRTERANKLKPCNHIIIFHYIALNRIYA
jgi:hypothetical protein